MNELINKYAKQIADKLKDNLEALILVGSYARGEGVDESSDIEFWAVANDLSMVRNIQIDSDVSIGYTTREHLKRLKPYIYTVEVKKYGKVIYGDKDILDLIPNYSFEDVDPIDGFTLLNNRLVEQLILLNRIEAGEAISQYEFDKGYIQLVNSILAINGVYKGLYSEKLSRYMSMPTRQRIIKLTDFDDKVRNAFDRLSKRANITISGSEAMEQWKELRDYFREIWLCEKKDLAGFACWLKMLVSGRPMRVWIYRRASNLYLSDMYKDKNRREAVIREWERFVK